MMRINDPARRFVHRPSRERLVAAGDVAPRNAFPLRRA
jgi:hypothetical protein